MNETGPDAVPPPASDSFEERSVERLDPVPDPHLNSIPSVFASVRIESIESFTELMKHAEHCGRSSFPTLNQTGLLNDMYLVYEQEGELMIECIRVLLAGKIPIFDTPLID